MKSSGWKVFIVSVVLVSLACGIGGVGDNAILRDDFSSNSSGWGTGTDEISSVEYGNGGLQFIVNSDRYVTWSTPNDEDYQNVHVEVTVNNESSDELAMFGIVCHLQITQSMYYLGVAADGYYTISKKQLGFDDESLVNGTSDVIPPSIEPFKLGADCGNGNLALYVNGQQIASAQDTTYTTGNVGLFAASNEETNATSVTFDDFVLTKLGE